MQTIFPNLNLYIYIYIDIYIDIYQGLFLILTAWGTRTQCPNNAHNANKHTFFYIL